MELTITAIVFSGLATLTSIVALLVSIHHKKIENRHIFYSKLEQKISDILFDKYPKFLCCFIDKNNRKITADKYGDIDDCFSELYSSINCLDYLNDKEYFVLKKSISNLEETLMYVKNEGYISEKVESIYEKNKELYSSFKKFSLKH